MDQNVYTINIDIKIEVSCDEFQFYEQKTSKGFYQFEEPATVKDIKNVVIADERSLNDVEMIFEC